MTELAAPQISSLMEALPGIAAVLRSPVANAIVSLSRAAAGLEEFDATHAEELLRFGGRRNLLTQEEIDSVIEELRVVTASRPKKPEVVVEKPKKTPPKPAGVAPLRIPESPKTVSATGSAPAAKIDSAPAKQAEVAKPAPKPPPTMSKPAAKAVMPAAKAATPAAKAGKPTAKPAKGTGKVMPKAPAKATKASKSVPRQAAKAAAAPKSTPKGIAKAPAKAAPKRATKGAPKSTTKTAPKGAAKASAAKKKR